MRTIVKAIGDSDSDCYRNRCQTSDRIPNCKELYRAVRYKFHKLPKRGFSALIETCCWKFCLLVVFRLFCICSFVAALLTLLTISPGTTVTFSSAFDLLATVLGQRKAARLVCSVRSIRSVRGWRSGTASKRYDFQWTVARYQLHPR